MDTQVIQDTQGMEDSMAVSHGLQTPEGFPVKEAESAEPEQETQSEPEKETKQEDENGHDDEWKGVPERFYSRFKDVNDKYKTLESKVGEYERDASAWREMAQLPEFRKFVGEMIANNASPKPQEPIFDASTVDFKDMTDGQIAQFLLEKATAMSEQKLSGQISELRAMLSELTGKERAREVDGFFQDTKAYPGAMEKRADIDSFMKKTGATFEEAYYAKVGKTIWDKAYQAGLKRTNEKAQTPPPPSQKSAPEVPAAKRTYKNITDAYNALKEQGRL